MLEEELAAVARAGFAGAEIFEADLLASHCPPDIDTMMRALGLRGYAVYRAPNAAIRLAAQARFKIVPID